MFVLAPSILSLLTMYLVTPRCGYSSQANKEENVRADRQETESKRSKKNMQVKKKKKKTRIDTNRSKITDKTERTCKSQPVVALEPANQNKKTKEGEAGRMGKKTSNRKKII